MHVLLPFSGNIGEGLRNWVIPPITTFDEVANSPFSLGDWAAVTCTKVFGLSGCHS